MIKTGGMRFFAPPVLFDFVPKVCYNVFIQKKGGKHTMSCEKCGASLDKKGVCTSCGAKRPKGRGYLIGHSILCCLLAVLLTVTILSLAVARSLLYNGMVLEESVRQIELATLPVGRFVGAEDEELNLAGYLLSEYVTDDDITEEEVATMIADLGAEEILEDKVNSYLSLFRGTSDEIPELSSAEIIELLEANEEKIFKTFAITIEESDKEMIAQELDPVLNAVNESVQSSYGSKFTRGVSRFWLSLPCFVILLILELVVMIRWCAVYKNYRGTASKGIKAFSISSIVPSLIFLLCGAAGMIFSTTLPDSNTANQILITIFSESGNTFAIFGGISTLVCIFLLILSKLLGMAPKQTPAANNAQDAAIESSPIVQEAVSPAAPQPIEEAPAPAPIESPAASELPCCPTCGKEAFKAEQKFCMSCGSAMQSPEPAPVVFLDKTEDATTESAETANETV